MDKQLVIAVLSFGTAVIGLVTAVAGRRREVVHRHVTGAHARAEVTPVGWVGRLLLTAGVAVGLGGLFGYLKKSGQADPPDASGETAGRLLAGPQGGTLMINAGDPIAWKGTGVTLRDAIVEVTFFAPDAPAGAHWVQSIWFRRAANSSRGWSVSVNGEGRWGVGGFNDQGEWVAGRPAEQALPSDLLAVGRGARNRFRVELNGNRGRLFVNDRLVSDFDASDVMSEGDVAVGFNVLRRDLMTRPVEFHYENLRVYAAR